MGPAESTGKQGCVSLRLLLVAAMIEEWNLENFVMAQNRRGWNSFMWRRMFERLPPIGLLLHAMQTTPELKTLNTETTVQPRWMVLSSTSMTTFSLLLPADCIGSPSSAFLFVAGRKSAFDQWNIIIVFCPPCLPALSVTNRVSIRVACQLHLINIICFSSWHRWNKTNHWNMVMVSLSSLARLGLRCLIKYQCHSPCWRLPTAFDHHHCYCSLNKNLFLA